MIKKQLHIQDQVLWHQQIKNIKTCQHDMQVDVVIVGGGMAGLAAAQEWHARGKKVVLLEQFYCGSGATGKSSGFVTPNAELSLVDFTHRYNADIASNIWKFISSGVDNIRSNIYHHNFTCDYQNQDTLVVANSAQDLKKLQAEHELLAQFGYQTQFYTKDAIQSQIGSTGYAGGVVYEKTFGMNGYLYCQQLKLYLQSVGVLIFEETPVISIQDHAVITPHAKITADYIVVCTDRFMPELGLLKQDVYHAQTFVMASQVLSDKQIHAMFPNRNFMVWDTELIYNYFRMTGDNRLLLGGGNLLSTYAAKPMHDYQAITKKLTNYFQQAFPMLDLIFEYQWPGLLGISKDIAPLVGRDKDRSYLFYVTAATGLPIAAACGKYSAINLLDNDREFENYFSPYRSFPISGMAQSILGNKTTFALCNLIKTNIP